MPTFKAQEFCTSKNVYMQDIKKKYWQNQGLLACQKTQDLAKCVPLSPCPKEILLECGPVGGENTFMTTGDTADVATLTVDTSCFCKPLIALQFSSQVSATINTENAQNDLAFADIQFDLVCRRNGGGELVVGNWSFRRLVGSSSTELETTDSFCFSRCLTPTNCTGCTDYFVRVTAISLSPRETSIVNALVTVTNGQLIAKIQDLN